MFRNYLKVAIRTLMKNKMFSFINVFGLALSMSVCLLVLLRIKDQLSYDTFHTNGSSTYRVITQLTDEQGNRYRFASSPLPLLPELQHDYNLLKASSRLYLAGTQKTIAGEKELNLKQAFADEHFFDVFSFPIAEGNKATALQEPNSVVLTQVAAERIFGKTTAVGKTLRIGAWGDFKVTAVLKETTDKSHLDFDAYMSMSSVASLEKNNLISPLLSKWDNFSTAYTYVVLKDGVKQGQLDNAVKNICSKLVRQSKLKGKENLLFETQALKRVILGEELMYTIGRVGNIGKIMAEVSIAFIILLSACFNYTNLSIARSLNRGKEIGIRKVSGAFRHQVFYQFIMESVIMALFSLVLAYVILQMIIDYAPFSSDMIPEHFAFDPVLFGWFAVFALCTGLLAGTLPAWTLSSFKPVQVLKNLSTVKLFGGNGFRKTLIVTQFALSLFIMVFTGIFSKQFDFLSTADPGFNRENILTINLQGIDHQKLANEVEKISGVEKVAATSDNLGRSFSGFALVKKDPAAQPIQLGYYFADPAFVDNMQLKLVAGQNLPADGNGQYILLNEKSLTPLHFNSADEAIGQAVLINDTTTVQVAGVIKDFYAGGLSLPVSPMFFRNVPGAFKFLSVRTSNRDPKLISAVEIAWKKLYPTQAFERSWLKEDLYARDSAWSTISMLGFLAIISVTIACLGLLGMVTYTMQTRKKEIGVRKVMGASVAVIMRILSKGFLKMLLIAGCIALPLSYIAGFFFLQVFANRISIGVDVLLFNFALLFIVVLVTIETLIYKTAIGNPVDALRTE